MRFPRAAEWRLFLALWPDAATRAALEAHQALWSWPAQARPTRPEKLHLTLHFIGNVPADRVATLQHSLRVRADSFALEFTRPALWAGGGGVAVVEPRQVPPALERLHGALAEGLRALELPVEKRPYRPHVTLARRAHGARPPVAAPAIAWQADGRYLLVRTAADGRYEAVQAFD